MRVGAGGIYRTCGCCSTCSALFRWWGRSQWRCIRPDRDGVLILMWIAISLNTDAGCMVIDCLSISTDSMSTLIIVSIIVLCFYICATILYYICYIGMSEYLSLESYSSTHRFLYYSLSTTYLTVIIAKLVLLSIVYARDVTMSPHRTASAI